MLNVHPLRQPDHTKGNSLSGFGSKLFENFPKINNKLMIQISCQLIKIISFLNYDNLKRFFTFY